MLNKLFDEDNHPTKIDSSIYRGMKESKGIWIPTQDNAGFWSAGYEIREYKKLNLSGNLALDIGAHVGIWSKRLSEDFNEVICFEPMTKHIKCHKKNCEGLDNVTLIENALSDIESESIMTTRDDNSGMSTLKPGHTLKRWGHQNPSEEIVQTKTLDSYDFPKIDFIKIDVEGWEEQVLRGGRETIKKYKPDIYMEIWKSNYNYYAEILTDMGYSLEKVSKCNYICKSVK